MPKWEIALKVEHSLDESFFKLLNGHLTAFRKEIESWRGEIKELKKEIKELNERSRKKGNSD